MEVILTPDGYYSQKELVLPEASAHCFSLTTDEPLPPCRIPPPEGDPISFPRGWLTPARQPLQGFADLWQTSLTLASFHCSFPTPLQGGTQNRTYSQGWLWQGWRVLEARCSFCISQQYSFFNLLIFFCRSTRLLPCVQPAIHYIPQLFSAEQLPCQLLPVFI